MTLLSAQEKMLGRPLSFLKANHQVSSFLIKVLVCLFFLGFASASVPAQTIVKNDETLQHHLFAGQEVKWLEDTSGRYKINDLIEEDKKGSLQENQVNLPKYLKPGSSLWYKIRISNSRTTKHMVLEFYDQTIDKIDVYTLDEKGIKKEYHLGDLYPFDQRPYQHKNFTIDLENLSPGLLNFYIRIRSHQPANVLIVLKSVSWFVKYALDEYFLFGMFYGMIIVFSIYNLMMFIALRNREYLYYIIYNLSVGLYEMCTDGIAYQYLWPGLHAWNQYAYGIPLFTASIAAILFTQKFLQIRERLPALYKVFNFLILFRCLFFLICLFYNKDWFIFKFFELIPLGFSFYAGCQVLYRGYKPARFFVIGYGFLLLGFSIKSGMVLTLPWVPLGPVTHYSLGLCFIMEILSLSFAISNRIRLLRMEVIEQLRSNEKLKDTLNNKLEYEVQERTKEVLEQASIIKKQNTELTLFNDLLKEQAEEISRMNVLLETDNKQLQTNIETVTKARVMSDELRYEEFIKIYPDQESCYQYLEQVKWQEGYICRKCNHGNYISGHTPYSRRCSKCGYDESVINYTIFQKTHLPINKAFYMLILIYSSRGKITSQKLSDMLEIRLSTCWGFSSRIKKIMEEHKKELRNTSDKGWKKLIMKRLEN